MNTAKNDLIGMCLTDLDRLQRQKIEAVITIQVHLMEIFRDIVKITRKLEEFNWQKQVRMYWLEDYDHCIASITDVDFRYSYEQLGAKERLGVTGLTDKCQITLSQALGMQFGGAPAGPAGTGKTETTKDMARTLGIYCVVTNCTPQQCYDDAAGIFKGLSIAGIWGCFDEFNRIKLEVLSVIATQVQFIKAAKIAQVTTMIFPDRNMSEIKFNPTVGYFITMNPGYAGRQELPENLKVQFRGVCMMVPDRREIMKTFLATSGYTTMDDLATKFNIVYKQCEEQLSKQRHYDFGLRNIKSVLRQAGNILRERLETIREKEGKNPEGEVLLKIEEELMYKALKDMNLSKLVKDDVLLFTSLLDDVFVNQYKKNVPDKEVREHSEEQIKENNLIADALEQDPWLQKILQLYDTSCVRHAFMLVGPTGTGKSNITKVLTSALTARSIKHFETKGTDKETWAITRLNPRSINQDQLYGERDESGEFQPGVFSVIWKDVNMRKPKSTISWMVADGPVDAIWVEDLNTVMDDNKILTLANNERIPMSENVKLVFENESLRNASPATVSRAGIVQVSGTDLGWYRLIRYEKRERETRNLRKGNDQVETYQNKQFKDKSIFTFLFENRIEGTVPTNEYCKLKSFIDLFNRMLRAFKVDNLDAEHAKLVEMIFVYCLCWGICGTFSIEDRKLISQGQFCLKANNFPCPKDIGPNETIYDRMLDHNVEKREWLKANPVKEKPSDDKPYARLLIANEDSAKICQIMNLMLEANTGEQTKKSQILLCGDAGTAKTSNILLQASQKEEREGVGFDFKKNFLLKRINFSFATSPGLLQEAIQEELEQKGSTLVPKKNDVSQMFFIDDLSMPEMNKYGDVFTLELVRQAVEDEGFQLFKRGEDPKFGKITKTLQVSAMTNPGGGKNDIPNRLKRQFFIINCLAPSSTVVSSIYKSMIDHKFTKVSNKEVTDNIEKMCQATVDLWNRVREKFIPTPLKFTYNFTLKDISKIMLGALRIDNGKLLESNKNMNVLPKDIVVYLWRNENTRVLSDRFVDENDLERFRIILDEITKNHFDEFVSEQKIIFNEFLQDDFEDENTGESIAAPFFQEPSPGQERLKVKAFERLKQYNADPKSKKMDLVLFEQCLEHVCRIGRMLMSKRVHVMLIGVGGSGKQCCTRLAVYMGRHKQCKQAVLTKNQGSKQFLEDYKEAWMNGAIANVDHTTFLLTDNEIKKEVFLEFVNSFLNTGEISGMLEKQDRDTAQTEAEKFMVKRGEDTPPAEVLYEGAVNKVMDSLHMVLAFSPANPRFRSRGIQFPSLFTSCSINFFFPWPEEALMETSAYLLSKETIYVEKTQPKENLQVYMSKVHKSVIEVSAEQFTVSRRNVYCTPKSFLAFVDMYIALYREKFKILDIEEKNIILGLETIAGAAEQIEGLQKMISEKKKDVDILLKDIKEKATIIKEKTDEAQKKATEVEAEAAKISAFAIKVGEEKGQAEEELTKSKPILEEALAALEKVTAKDIDNLVKMPTDKMSIAIKMCFDCVAVQLYSPVRTVEAARSQVSKAVPEVSFIKDSQDLTKKNLLKNSSAGLIRDMQSFGEFKDKLTDESVELAENYLNQEEWFNIEVLTALQGPAANMVNWVACMRKFRGAYKMIAPLMAMVQEKGEELTQQQGKLKDAQDELAAVKANVAQLQADLKVFQDQADEKTEILDEFQKKLRAAKNLIDSLEINRVRWEKDKNNYNNLKIRLIGDVGISCAFLAQCGPFNTQFRAKILESYLKKIAIGLKFPFNDDLDLINFLATPDKVGAWNLMGLPNDELSKQNGIIIDKSKRFPLIIDPQNQARTWLERMWKSKSEGCMKWITDLNDTRLLQQLRDAIESGFPFILENVENEIDPGLDPVVDKQIIMKGAKKKLMLGEDEIDWHDDFKLFCTSRMTNPAWSPEMQAKMVVIDFTVTRTGLEEQLLGVVINQEKAELEEILNNLMSEINQNVARLKDLDEKLLETLAAADKEKILEDKELVDMLSKVKSESKKVESTIKSAEENKIQINKQRKEQTEVAVIGSVLQFVIIDLGNTNHMYNVSLKQFMKIFLKSIEVSKVVKEKGEEDDEEEIDTSVRVQQIYDMLIEVTYKYTMRGLFERDKLSFKVILCMKYLMTYEKITAGDISFFLKASTGVPVDESQYRKPDIPDQAWKNILQLNEMKFGRTQSPKFSGIAQKFSDNPQEVERFQKSDTPEDMSKPDFSPILQSMLDQENDDELKAFQLVVFIRCFRMDRNNVCCKQLVHACLNKKSNFYTDPLKISIEDTQKETDPQTPVLFLLSKGADPTAQVEGLCAMYKKPTPEIISMGEGQEVKAEDAIGRGKVDGRWVMLNNSHLSLDQIATMEYKLKPPEPGSTEVINENFRLFLSCDPTNEYPLGVLQMSIKVTDEPPKGMKDGLYRVYTTVVNQDRLEKILDAEKAKNFRRMIQVLCQLHCCVVERRKFGPIGFCVPQEFNSTDLDVALIQSEKHILASDKVNYETLKYMVWEVIYGGKITDNYDNELFDTYTQVLVCHRNNNVEKMDRCFANQPDNTDKIYMDERPYNREKAQFKDGQQKALGDSKLKELKCIHDWILDELNRVENPDNPTAFQMNPLSDFNCRLIEVDGLIETMINVQPKETGGAATASPEQVVDGLVVTYKAQQDKYGIDMQSAEERLNKKGNMFDDSMGKGRGLEYPLNVFYKFEIERYISIVGIMKTTLDNIRAAIKGEIIMTTDLSEAISAIFNNKIPQSWLFNAAGEEISWMMSSIANWYKQYEERWTELDTFVRSGHTSETRYKLVCMFNPQGFVNSVKQEIVRLYNIRPEKDKFKIGNMFMVTWAHDENAKRTKEFDQQDIYFKCVKLSMLVMEGAVFDRSMKLVDDPEKLVQDEGFYLKITFYSDCAKGGQWASPSMPSPPQWEEINNKLKQLQNENHPAGRIPDSRAKVPIYKYKKRNDRYMICPTQLDTDFPTTDKDKPDQWGVATSKDICKLRGTALFAAQE